MAVKQGYYGALYLARRTGFDTGSGSGGTITVSDPSDGHLDFGSNQDFSIEVWVKGEGTDSTLIEKKGAGTAVGYSLYLGSGRVYFAVYDGSTEYYVRSGDTTINDGKYHHIVGVRDGSALRLYLDGTEFSDSGYAGSLSNSDDFVVGGGADGYTFSLVRVYNTAVSSSQATSLKNGNLPSALVEYIVGDWEFTEGAGTTIYDSSDYKSNGTASSSNGWTTTTYESVSNESVGTGNGSTKEFQLDNSNIDCDNITITVGGVAKTIDKDYFLSPSGKITFVEAPGSGEAIVASYRYYPVVLEITGFHAWSVEISAETHDITDFTSGGTGARKFVGGLTSWTGSAERWWTYPLFSAFLQSGGRFIVRFYLDESGGNYLTGWAEVSGITTNVATDGIVEEPISFQGVHNITQET